MNKKYFYTVILIIVILLLLVCSWKYLLCILAGAAVFYFVGEKKLKEFISDFFQQSKKTLKELQEETTDVEIESVSMTSSKKEGWYQVVVVASGKSYLLKPSATADIPSSLRAGKKAVIKTVRKINLATKSIDIKTTISVGDDVFEVMA